MLKQVYKLSVKIMCYLSFPAAMMFRKVVECLQGSRLTVANWPQTSKNSILAGGFCVSLVRVILHLACEDL